VFAVPPAWVASTCLYETDYFCIKVRNEEQDGKPWKVLVLDRLVHSFTAVGEPTQLRYAYERAGAEVSEFLQDRDGAQRVFFIGGGGYTLPRFIEHRFPNALIDVAEIDPMVTETAYRHLELIRPGDPLSKTVITAYSQDARLFLVNRAAQRAAPRYNFVLGDAFNDFSVPYHLTTREFNQLVRAQLTDDGIYMLNLIDGNDLPFVTAFIRTLRQTFQYVYFVPTGGYWRAMTRNTFVVLASPRPIDMTRLSGFDGGDGNKDIQGSYLDERDFEAFLRDGPKFLLTDDYVPTDILLAPMFEASAK
jgi:spermidine synthase